jgi:hypothetical protein
VAVPGVVSDADDPRWASDRRQDGILPKWKGISEAIAAWLD